MVSVEQDASSLGSRACGLVFSPFIQISGSRCLCRISIFRVSTAGIVHYLMYSIFEVFVYLNSHLIFFAYSVGVQVAAKLFRYLFGQSLKKFIMPSPIVGWSTLKCPLLTNLTSAWHLSTGDFRLCDVPADVADDRDNVFVQETL